MKTSKETKKAAMIAIVSTGLLVAFVGCAGATGAAGIESGDPTERGLSYIAAAIVTNAVIRALFNK